MNFASPLWCNGGDFKTLGPGGPQHQRHMMFYTLLGITILSLLSAVFAWQVVNQPLNILGGAAIVVHAQLPQWHALPP